MMKSIDGCMACGVREYEPGDSGVRWFVFLSMPRREAWKRLGCPPACGGEPGQYFQRPVRIRVSRSRVLITQSFGWDV